MPDHLMILRFCVTTLHETEPATLENAMIYSDNIYFAKVALKLGENNLTSFLEKLGFNKEIPFDIKMSISQYSNTEGIKSEIQLADSGYGQGQILINPLHLASIYSAFSNDGKQKCKHARVNNSQANYHKEYCQSFLV